MKRVLRLLRDFDIDSKGVQSMILYIYLQRYCSNIRYFVKKKVMNLFLSFFYNFLDEPVIKRLSEISLAKLIINQMFLLLIVPPLVVTHRVDGWL